jgi:competence protein ComEC
MGIDHLDGVILTHNHPDHVSGLSYIIERFPVERFYLATNSSELNTELQRALQRYKVDVIMVDEGWSYVHKDSRRELRLFVPDQTAGDINERSIAVYARYLERGAMLTADLGKSGLRQILDSGVPGKISLLKLPHHGSRHAAPDLFLEEFRPSTVFASAGRGNPYGLPHIETVEACARRKIPFYRTDQMGMLRFRVHNGEWQVLTYNPKRL